MYPERAHWSLLVRTPTISGAENAIYFAYPHTELGSYQTAWTLLHMPRTGLSALPAPLLEGNIGADETYIGGLSQGVERAWNRQSRGEAIAVEHRGRTAGCVRLAVIPGATTAGLTSLCEGRGCASDRNGSYRCLDRHSPKWESTIGLARADTDDTQRTVYPGLTLSSAISRHGYDVPITESVLHIFSAT